MGDVSFGKSNLNAGWEIITTSPGVSGRGEGDSISWQYKKTKKSDTDTKLKTRILEEMGSTPHLPVSRSRQLGTSLNFYNQISKVIFDKGKPILEMSELEKKKSQNTSKSAFRPPNQRL